MDYNVKYKIQELNNVASIYEQVKFIETLSKDCQINIIMIADNFAQQMFEAITEIMESNLDFILSQDPIVFQTDVIDFVFTSNIDNLPKVWQEYLLGWC